MRYTRFSEVSMPKVDACLKAYITTLIIDELRRI